MISFLSYIIDDIVVRKSNTQQVRDVKVTAGEECVLQCRLLVCDMLLNWRKKVKQA